MGTAAVERTRHVAMQLVEARMSVRARVYLWLTALPALGVGLFCLLGGQMLRAPAYSVIRAVGFDSMVFWGVLYLLVAVTSVAAAIRANETLARVALMSSAGVMAGWAAGFGIAYHTHHLAGPAGVLIWGTLAVKDLAVCRQPLRSPFESIASALSHESDDAVPHQD